jgi:hypothetical protein
MYLETSSEDIEFFVHHSDGDHSEVIMGVPNFDLNDLLYIYDIWGQVTPKDWKPSELKEWKNFFYDLFEQYPKIKIIVEKLLKNSKNK